MNTNKKIRVAINGLGRIGRAFLKIAWERDDIEVVVANDLGTMESLAYLLKYDTVYGKWEHDVQIEKNNFIIDGKKLQFISEKDPGLLPWKELDIDVVVESTGVFTSFDKAKAHLDSGAKKVVLSAPAKGESETRGETILLGVNEEKLGITDITSNASCTTNAVSPLIAVLNESLGIEKAILNTVHGYTATQAIVDGPSKKDLREGRAAAQNIIPSSTGAAFALAKAMPEFNNLFDGISLRVPVVCGSIVDLTFISKRETSREEVNQILEKASREDRWKNLLKATYDPLVSSDILGDNHACIADLEMTKVVGGNLVKVLGWYDNEMGYAYTLLDHALKTAKTIK